MDTSARPVNDDIDLRDLVTVLAREKWLLVCTTALFTFAALAASLLLTKQYEARVVIAPVADEAGGGRLGNLPSLISQVGQLSSLAGLSIGNSAERSEALAVLQSDALTERFIAENDLLPVLYQKQWDASLRRWGVSAAEAPTLWKAKEYFRKHIGAVDLDSKTGLATLVITWKNPIQAADWANELVKMTNDYLRAKAINESKKNIAFLSDQAARTDVVGVKTAIYSILQNEMYKMMLAQGSSEYALKVIDPALAPEKPSSPRPMIWSLVGMFAGLIVSIFLVALRSALAKN